MANNSRDLMGLLTGIPSEGIDPRVGLTPQQMQADAFYSGMERMGRGVRGMNDDLETILYLDNPTN